MDRGKILTILEKWFKDPIDVPCCYCKATEEICQLAKKEQVMNIEAVKKALLDFSATGTGRVWDRPLSELIEIFARQICELVDEPKPDKEARWYDKLGKAVVDGVEPDESRLLTRAKLEKALKMMGWPACFYDSDKAIVPELWAAGVGAEAQLALGQAHEQDTAERIFQEIADWIERYWPLSESGEQVTFRVFRQALIIKIKEWQALKKQEGINKAAEKVQQ